MKRYIEKLHEQPVHQKREFAAHAAAGITVVVFFVWLSTLGIRFLGNSSEAQVAGTDAGNLIAATAAAGATLQNQIHSMSAGVQTADSSRASADGSDPSTAATEPAIVIGAANDATTDVSTQSVDDGEQ